MGFERPGAFGSFGVRSVMVFLAIVSIIYGALAMYFVVKKTATSKLLRTRLSRRWAW